MGTITIDRVVFDHDPDELADSPRVWAHLDTMLCRHPRDQLDDK